MRTSVLILLAASGAASTGSACRETKCVLACEPAPPGCHVEGANSSTDCSKASCGTIVCPDAGSSGGADASPDAGAGDAIPPTGDGDDGAPLADATALADATPLADATAPGDATAPADGAAPDTGGPGCGSTTCAAGQYCCDPSCSLCAPSGALCVFVPCDAGSSPSDAAHGSGCTAVPQNDGQCFPVLRHFYRCVVPYTAPNGCSALTIGNATDTYCCL